MKSLTIGFDARNAMTNLTGLGNYSRRVIDVLSNEHPDWRFLLYSPEMGDNPRVTPLLEHANTEVVTPSGRFWQRFNTLWRMIGGLTSSVKRDGLDLFHGLCNELPLDIKRAGIPSVVTVHDLIPSRYRSTPKSSDRSLYNFKLSHAVANATRIIAVSESTKRDIVDIYKVNPEKIDVVYQCCDPIFSQTVPPETILQARRRYKISGRYILTVGTVEERKNQLLPIKALPWLPHDMKLVIVGRRTKEYAAQCDEVVKQLDLGNRVIWLENIGMNGLVPLYAGSAIGSYTSRYEGFGLPVIESISCGKPVIAATGSCLEEAGGPGAIYVDPDDVTGYVEAATELLTDPILYSDLVTAGRHYVTRFSEKALAEGITASYKKAIENF